MKMDIKTYREKELRSYVIGNIIFVLFATGLLDSLVNPPKESIHWDVINAVISSALFATVGYIFVFIADSLIPSDVKQKIIWLRKGMPGERVFTEIRKNNKDKRFTIESVLNKYADVYKNIDKEQDPKKKRKLENANWYQIYKVHEEEATVYVSQRDYLLSRDMCVITIWIIIGFFVLIWIFEFSFHWKLFVFMIVEMVATWFGARFKGKQFVYNVIAVDVSKKEMKSLE